MPKPHASMRRRFWIETALACLTGGLCILTAGWHDWLEAFGIEPDGGNGSAEWAIVAVLAACSLALAVTARIEWSRAASA
jgi:hypothetical protein